MGIASCAASVMMELPSEPSAAVARRAVMFDGIRDDGIAVSVIVGRRQESSHVCKDRLANLDCVFCRVEVRNGNLTKIRREDERVLVRHGEGRLAGASDLAGSIVNRPAQ